MGGSVALVLIDQSRSVEKVFALLSFQVASMFLIKQRSNLFTRCARCTLFRY